MFPEYSRYYAGPLTVSVGIVGFYLGGYWLWLGFSTYFVAAALDIFLSRDTVERNIKSGMLADLPLYLHAFLLPLLYVTFAWRAIIDGGVGTWSGLEIGGAIASLAWLSAVPNLPIQHELLHRRTRFSQACAFWLGGLYGDPLRGIPHVIGHHIHLGTPTDADTARRGETMYSFPWRVTYQCWRESAAAERARLASQNRGFWHPDNRCLQALAFEIVLLLAVALIAGIGAALLTLTAIVLAKALVEAFNYYQHYGLIRVPGQPYARRHLWNHLQPVARALAVEITNHSDHHMDSYKPFYRLKPDLNGPQMPSIFLCFMLGLIPPLWYKLVAQPRLKDWDERFATAEEREIARADNARAGWPDWFSDMPGSHQSPAPIQT